MSKYFHISHGLRGCYIHDNVQVIRCETRRELKNALMHDARDYQGAGLHLNRKHVAAVAAAVWREAHKPNPTYLDFVVPIGRDHIGDRPFGIMASVATRADYLAQQED